MNNFIRKMTITGLFEEDEPRILDFSEDINCIFGVNGSGKTTIINLIVYMLNCSVKRLIDLPFHSATMELCKFGNKKSKELITVTKVSENTILYHFSPEDIREEVIISTDESAPKCNKYEEVLQLLNKKVRHTHVPLSRLQDAGESQFETYDNYMLSKFLQARHMPKSEILNIIDPTRRMMSDLSQQFEQKYMQIQKVINKETDRFKNTLVRKTLLDDSYTEKVDELFSKWVNYPDTDLTHYDSTTIMEKLKTANIDISKVELERHLDVWENINKDIIEAKSKLGPDNNNIGDYAKCFFRMFALKSLFDTFMSIISDIEDMEKKKNDMLKLFSETESVINEFFKKGGKENKDTTKRFYFDQTGRMRIKSPKKDLKLTELSSGEKHLIALLGRVALAQREGSIFIADEPELSLHLEWQRKIIPAIKQLSPKTQIIVATHSPAIIPSKAKMIKLGGA